MTDIHTITPPPAQARDQSRLLLDSVTDAAILLVDPAGRISSWNTGAERITGYTAAQAAGQSIACVYTSADVAADKPTRDLRAALERSRVEESGLRVRADGTRFWARCTLTALYEGGRHIGFAAVIRDATAQKESEGRLRRTADLLRAVADGTTDAVFVKDRAGRYLLFNEAAARFVGKPVGEVLGKDDTQLFEPDSARRVMERDQRIMATARGETSEDVLTAAGVTRTYQATKAPYRDEHGRVIGLIGISRDVSEHKRAEQALRQREDLLRNIIEHIPCGVFWKDRNCVYLGCNEQVARNHGLDSAERLVGGTDYDLGVLPAEAEFYREYDRRVMETGEPILNLEETQTRPDGNTAVLMTSKVPLRDPSGTVIGVLVVYQDITHLKQVEAALRTAEHRLQHVIASNPAVLFTLTVEDEQIRGIGWVSETVEGMLGYAAGEVVGPTWWMERVHPEDLDGVVAHAHRELFASGRATNEYRFRHRDGRYRWLRSELRLSCDAAGRAVEVVGIWSDVTEPRRIEEHFRQTQKMEAIGKLAGGIAHDFNNLLTVINGYGDLLMTALAPSDPNRELMAAVRDAGERAAALTQQLLAFSRKAIVEPKVIDLNDAVAQLARLLHRLIGEDVVLAIALAPTLGRVKADPSQVEQVILNLAVNARDAMPRGGQLTIETRDVLLREDDLATYPGLKPGRHVQLLVSDTGTGMTEEVRARVFEPFFTTKAVGKGTGLGLATVYGIVHTCAGHVSVRSEVGVGSTFEIVLPTVTESPRGPVPGVAKVAPKGTETVLLVEDEPAVRSLARHILQMQGYAVRDAGDGADALRLAEQCREPIDLLVTDVVMPGMGGREVAEAVRRRHPGVKVLYTSGYTDDEVVRHGVVEGADPFLQKPFTPLTLARKVRAVLDGVG